MDEIFDIADLNDMADAWNIWTTRQLTRANSFAAEYCLTPYRGLRFFIVLYKFAINEFQIYMFPFIFFQD